MDKLNFQIFDPTGNITGLVTDNVSEDLYAEISRCLMDQCSLIEQVGFIKPGGTFKGGLNYRRELRMAGGEFCGNASMSTAFLVCMEDGILPGEERDIYLKVSGFLGPVPVNIKLISKDMARGRVKMPSAEYIKKYRLSDFPDVNFSEDDFDLVHVRMPGIDHFLIPDMFGIENAEKYLPYFQDIFRGEASGIMLHDEDFSHVTPLVYVPLAGTLVREHSCLSGSAAIGSYLSENKEGFSKEIHEPGGTLKLLSEKNGIYIEGIVKKLL